MEQQLKIEQQERRSRTDTLLARAETQARVAMAARIRPERFQPLTESAMAEARAGEAAAHAAAEVLRELQPRLNDLRRALDQLDAAPNPEVPPT